MDDFITKAMQLADAMASGSCGDYKARRAALLAHLEGGRAECISALEEAQHAFEEIRHGLENPGWFTKGQRAATIHVHNWVRRGVEAVKKRLDAARASDALTKSAKE